VSVDWHVSLGIGTSKRHPLMMPVCSSVALPSLSMLQQGVRCARPASQLPQATVDISPACVVHMSAV
jgi:hypothetical protein